MTSKKLKQIVKKSRPLGSFNSLPFVTEKDGKLQMRWFVYTLNQYGSFNELDIKSICTVDKNDKINVIATNNLAFALSTDDIGKDVDSGFESNFNENEYYDNFVVAFNKRDKNTLDGLLNRAEAPSSRTIYNLVGSYEL